MDAKTRDWSPRMVDLLAIPRRLLPRCATRRHPRPAHAQRRRPHGPVARTSRPRRRGRLPMALLASGALDPGTGSDVTGTSTILTLIQPAPVAADGVSTSSPPPAAGAASRSLTRAAIAVRWAAAPSTTTRSTMPRSTPPPPRPAGANALFFLPYLSANALARIAIRGRSSSASPPPIRCPTCTAPCLKVWPFLSAANSTACRATTAAPPASLPLQAARDPSSGCGSRLPCIGRPTL